MNKFEYALYIRRQQVREHRNRALEQQRKRMKQQKRKQNIIIIGAIAIAIIIVLCIIGSGVNDITECVEAGNTKEYCIRGL
jgi:TRAP-type mannitol/chloroaromatic compound transport system permease large subunit